MIFYVAKVVCWSVRNEQNLKKGIKTTYRCNLVKCKGDQCAAQVYSIHDNQLPVDSDDSSSNESSDDCDFLLYRNNKNHTHDKLKNRSAKVSENVKHKIIALHKTKLTPAGISIDR